MSYWMAVRRRLAAAALAGIDVAALAITYTGNMTDEIVTMGDGKQYRLLTLTSSGTLSISAKVKADVWLCGGGAKGNPTWTGGVMTGHGGSGGFIAQALRQAIMNITAVVGAAAGNSSISGDISLSANGAGSPTIYSNADLSVVYGSSGGGGRCVYRQSVMSSAAGLKGTGETTYPFGDTIYFAGKPHCAGGGGGAYDTSEYLGDSYAADGGAGGTNGGNGGIGDYLGYVSAFGYGTPGAGGTLGGGRGGSSNTGKGTAATFYGSGGGGGGYHERDEEGDISEYTYAPGAGYQGVIYVRIPLKQ